MPNETIIPLDHDQQKLVNEVVKLLAEAKTMKDKAYLDEHLSGAGEMATYVEKLLNNTRPEHTAVWINSILISKAYIEHWLHKAKFVVKKISESVLPLSSDDAKKAADLADFIYVAYIFVNQSQRVPVIETLADSINRASSSLDQFLKNADSNLTIALLDDLESVNNHLHSDYNSAMWALDKINEGIKHKAEIHNAVNETYLQAANLKLSLENTNPMPTERVVSELIVISTNLQNSIKNIVDPNYDLLTPKQNTIAMYGIQECIPAPHTESAIMQNSSQDIATINNWTNSPYAWGIGGFLLGAIVLRPAVRMTANIGYATVNVASYALNNIFNVMQYLRRPANYQPIPGDINMHAEGELEPALANNDVVLNIEQAPDEEEKVEDIIKSNNAIIADIKNLVMQNDWSLLSEEEIETYKLKTGISEFESHVNTSACSIHLTPMKNPITIKFATPEGQLNGRSWEYTADAEALIKFIEKCNRDKKPAYAPATRDLLNHESVSFKSGFSDQQDEASIKAYAAGIKNRLSFWKAQEQQQAMLEVNDLSLSHVNPNPHVNFAS